MQLGGQSYMASNTQADNKSKIVKEGITQWRHDDAFPAIHSFLGELRLPWKGVRATQVTSNGPTASPYSPLELVTQVTAPSSNSAALKGGHERLHDVEALSTSWVLPTSNHRASQASTSSAVT